MKKSLMMAGLAAMMGGTSGCFSFLSSWSGGGPGATAVVLDVATSPIQIGVVAGFFFVVLPAEIAWYKGIHPVIESTEGYFRSLNGPSSGCQTVVDHWRDEFRRDNKIVFREDDWLNMQNPYGKFEALRAEVEYSHLVDLDVLSMLAYRTIKDKKLMEELGGIWKDNRLGGEFRGRIIENYSEKYNFSQRELKVILDHPCVSDAQLKRYAGGASSTRNLRKTARRILKQRNNVL